jgi:hypothetical protein
MRIPIFELPTDFIEFEVGELSWVTQYFNPEDPLISGGTNGGIAKIK